MRLNTKRFLGVALVLAMLVVAGLQVDRLEPVETAQAQVQLPPRGGITLAEEAQVSLNDIGRLPGTNLIYVEFAAGGRCLASASGDGDIDCDW